MSVHRGVLWIGIGAIAISVAALVVVRQAGSPETDTALPVSTQLPTSQPPAALESDALTIPAVPSGTEFPFVKGDPDLTAIAVTATLPAQGTLTPPLLPTLP